MHELRQVRERLPDRRTVQKRQSGGRERPADRFFAIPEKDARGKEIMEADSQTQPAKPRLATVWLDGCSGCHMSFLDLDEKLVDIVTRADLVYSPLVDKKVFPDHVDVTLVEGAVSSEEDLEKIKRIRARTTFLVAL